MKVAATVVRRPNSDSRNPSSCSPELAIVFVGATTTKISPTARKSKPGRKSRSERWRGKNKTKTKFAESDAT